MFIVGLLSWWYSAGWRQRFTMLRERLANTIDYFSIDLLAKTLFSPFRQISAGRVDGPLGVRLRAFMDRIISRGIGAMVRLTMIVIGTGAIVMHSVLGIITVVMWAIVPILPLIGIILFISGWIPWSL
ncbi:MAG TPA: hypothetical protein VFM68_01240 [Candidatus Saccharimonadales bacterium]|nr:hypothetical protein [Candidatus Saccharimonadales bacterium]